MDIIDLLLPVPTGRRNSDDMGNPPSPDWSKLHFTEETPSEPTRYQLKRTKGYRKPKGSVIVDRRTMWGNIFAVKGPYPKHEMPFMVYCNEGPGVGSYLGSYKTKKEASQRAVDLFDQYFDNTIAEPGSPLYEFRQAYGWHGFQLACVCENLLHGKSIGCWCKTDMPCHGNVVLKRANPELKLP